MSVVSLMTEPFEWQQSIEQEHAASIEEAPERMTANRRAKPDAKPAPPSEEDLDWEP